MNREFLPRSVAVNNNPLKLYELALAKVIPGEFVTALKKQEFLEKIKLIIFKRIVKSIYLSLPHFKVFGF